MKERPILFSGPMVRAILDDRKTQTRRVIRDDWWRCNEPEDFQPGGDRRPGEYCPYGDIGDRLWVRETFWTDDRNQRPIATSPQEVIYDATPGIARDHWGKVGPCTFIDGTVAPIDLPMPHNKNWRKRPSLFMPRWASRILLEITDVRVQRLHDISEEDAISEGIETMPEHDHHARPTGRICGLADYGQGDQEWRELREAFECLWDSINGKRAPWESNPLVWAITFRRVNA